MTQTPAEIARSLSEAELAADFERAARELWKSARDADHSWDRQTCLRVSQRFSLVRAAILGEGEMGASKGHRS